MSMIKEQVEELREEADFIVENIDKDFPVTIGVAKIMKRAADTIEAYQKAFEDIKTEIWDSGMNMTGEYQGVWIRYRDIEKIFDKHNPDKVGKER